MTFDELVSKLEVMPKPDSNVDMWLMYHLLGRHPHHWRNLLFNASWPLSGVQYIGPTGSIDGAVLLLKQAFPGFIYRIAECCVSDDAWVIPDFNDPNHGTRLQRFFPVECQKDPTEWMGTDVDRRPAGRPAIALCLSMMLAKRKIATLLK